MSAWILAQKAETHGAGWRLRTEFWKLLSGCGQAIPKPNMVYGEPAYRYSKSLKTEVLFDCWWALPC